MHPIFWFCFVCNSTIIFLPFDCTTRMLFVRIEFDSLSVSNIPFFDWFLFRFDSFWEVTMNASAHKCLTFVRYTEWADSMLFWSLAWFGSFPITVTLQHTFIEYCLRTFVDELQNSCENKMIFLSRIFFDFLFCLFDYMCIVVSDNHGYNSIWAWKSEKKRWIGFSLQIPIVHQIKMQKPKED